MVDSHAGAVQVARDVDTWTAHLEVRSREVVVLDEQLVGAAGTVPPDLTVAPSPSLTCSDVLPMYVTLSTASARVRATPPGRRCSTAPAHNDSTSRERRREGPVGRPFPRIHSDIGLLEPCQLERIADVRRGHRRLANADARGVEDRVRHGRADCRRRRLAGTGQRPSLVERLGVSFETSVSSAPGLIVTYSPG